MTAGLILAAGESHRMGSPKALLEYRGETFLDRLIGQLARYCSPVIAVLGAHEQSIRAGLRRTLQARLVTNPEYQRGQLSSMQCGLRAVPADSCGVLFTLVDHPCLTPPTIAALLDSSAPLRIPRYKGQRGHPIWFAPSLAAEFLAATESAREVIARHSGEIAYIEVDDPGILADIDDRAAYAELLGSL